MDERIQLRVMGLSYSQLQSGAFALILAQVDGPYRIPVVIGAPEAQSIAIRMEGLTPPRPMTHDLFTSFTHAFGVKLKEVFIYKFEDGIFSSELTFTDGERTVVLDSRTSDAVAIALRTKAPIFTTKTILDETGFILDDNNAHEHPVVEPEPASEPKIENYAIEELERTLNNLIEREDYEEAARIKQLINEKRRRNNSGDQPSTK